jgi:phasin
MANPKKVAPLAEPMIPAALENVSVETKGALETAATPIGAFQEMVRRTVEKSVAEGRAAYSRVQVAADEAASALETSVTNASKGVIDFNGKAIDAWRANIDAGLDFAKAAINIKTVGEFVSLQGEHASRQAEVFAAQAKAFGALAQKIAADTAEPIKTQVAKAFRLSA